MMSDHYNPYLDSKRLWNEIYGSIENKLKHAQIIIAILSVVIVMAISALIYVATSNHVTPYIVTLRGNELVTVNELQNEGFRAFQPKLAMNLSQAFIQQVRNRTLDKTVNNDNRAKAYAVASNSTTSVIKTHYDELALDDMLTKVDINAVLLKSNNTIELRWKESKYDKTSGIIQSLKAYSADLTYEFSKVSVDPVVASHNPLGFYITSIAWSEDLPNVRE